MRGYVSGPQAQTGIQVTVGLVRVVALQLDLCLPQVIPGPEPGRRWDGDSDKKQEAQDKPAAPIQLGEPDAHVLATHARNSTGHPRSASRAGFRARRRRWNAAAERCPRA